MTKMLDVATDQTIESVWGNAIRDRTVQRFASKTELDTWTTAGDGALAYTTDTNRLWLRKTTAWLLVGGSMPRVELRRAADQSLANGVNVLLTWDTENVDTDGLHSTAANTARITIPAGFGGRWRFDALVTFSLATVTGTRAAWFSKNDETGAGAARIHQTELPGNGGGATAVPLSRELVLVPGDYIAVMTVHTAGAANPMSAGSSMFGAQYVGPS